MKLASIIHRKPVIIAWVIAILALIIIFRIASSGTEVATEGEKQNFYVEVQNFSDFASNHLIEKTGTLSSEQSIALNSKATWEVASIVVKAGDSVKKWQPLMYVNDSIANYEGSLNGAAISVESAKINYETQKINLEKAVADTKLNYERTQENYEISKAQIEEDKKKAEIDFENSKLNVVDSSSSLQLQKIEEQIAKAEFDYENLLISNDQQVISYISNAKNEYSSLFNLYTDVIEFGDSILWVTDENRNENDDFEDLLWAFDKNSLSDSKSYLNQLIDYKNNLETIDSSNISESTVVSFLDQFNDGHELLISFLQSIEKTLLASLDSTTFGTATYVASANTYQTQVQSGKSQFTATKSAADTFLKTYELSEESSKKQIELLYTDKEITSKNLWDGEEFGEIAYNKTILSLDDQLSALNTSLENAELNYENAKKQLDVSLRSLNNQIKSAQNGYSTALKEYRKLTITSPIDGVVWSISVQEGQEISQGTPLLFLSNVSKGEVKVYLSKQELDLVKEGQEAFLDIGGATIKGELVSVSKIANSSLNYEASILIDDSISIVGNVVDVQIPVTLENPLFPVKIIETIGNGKAQIKVLSETGSWMLIENKIIDLGSIWGNSIEVISELEKNSQVITSEVGNYDPLKFTLQLNSQESGAQ